jgi:hypothetical protein
MATFKNTANGQVYKLGIEVKANETILEAAWTRGLNVACKIKGWNRHDVVVVEAK